MKAKNIIYGLLITLMLCVYMGFFEPNINLKLFWLGIITLIDIGIIKLVNIDLKEKTIK